MIQPLYEPNNTRFAIAAMMFDLKFKSACNLDAQTWTFPLHQNSASIGLFNASWLLFRSPSRQHKLPRLLACAETWRNPIPCCTES